MRKSKILGINIPEYNDPADIGVIGQAIEMLEQAATSSTAATASTDGAMSAVDKKKLDGIEDGANKYIHPDTHSADEIFLSDGESVEDKIKTLSAQSSTASVVDNLESDSATDSLSARQGKLISTQLSDMAKQLSSISAIPFSIPATAWEMSMLYVDYPYQAVLPVPGLAAGDLIRADFDAPSLIAATEADVMRGGDTEDGIAIFYAQEMPEVILSGMYTIHKAVS